MPNDPTATDAIFRHDRVAAGYATARPFLHPTIFALVRDSIRPASLFGRALDVGCGTGMSSVALLDLAQHVIGADSSVEMLLRAKGTGRIRYLASSAETLPFRGGCFDMVVACGSIDWVDRTMFMPEVHEVLAAGGWLIPLDFGDTGKSQQAPGLEIWHKEVFLRAYPRPMSRDPLISAEEAAAYGFTEPILQRFTSPCSFTAASYADFLMTESNVIAAVEYGRQSADQVRGWLASELIRVFAGAGVDVLFGGYFQILRKR